MQNHASVEPGSKPVAQVDKALEIVATNGLCRLYLDGDNTPIGSLENCVNFDPVSCSVVLQVETNLGPRALPAEFGEHKPLDKCPYRSVGSAKPLDREAKKVRRDPESTKISLRSRCARPVSDDAQPSKRLMRKISSNTAM